MSRETDVTLRNKIIYSVYVRNHGKNGTFKDVEDDLERIKDLGADIIWLMPIHPIGVVNKKGTLGCPYAIKDYRDVNPEYGTLEDFKRLLSKIHTLGMKCIIDVVYNHTSPDSYLAVNHPEYFYKKPDGKMGNRVGEWTDVVDLDYSNIELWDYQIETLKYWVSLGVDGFRCDVASLLPIEFWLKAREEVLKINKDAIFLAESVHPGFIIHMRENGFNALSDSEVFQAFDICYDYDVHDEFMGYFKGTNGLKEYIKRLQLQEAIYPANYVKLRFLENHDQPRAKKIIPDEVLLKTWTAFIYFQKGATLIYAGQEAQDSNTPSLFEIDKVDWSGLNQDFVEYMKRLSNIKKKEIMAKGNYRIGLVDNMDVILATYSLGDNKLIGIFNVGKHEGEIKLDLEDGIYSNLISNEDIEVYNGKIKLKSSPIIIEI
ncbi:Alpha-1,4-glucan:maltose-1-phosphate maltosyltransferase 2 [Caloramator mitchellensis]|uniref:Alpha-1,4-glucan:maltose-1-phosphate maltosyltransferase 2 n=1 Tax=Caloramator mitchellensis TaxID=908809 RepID=A0A0R3JTE2_CALMK|nr:alpha-amylase family glycosyl hydrolase [Caloramator mitchellensis]KRQ86785.1 Alpha-1,4-glucan:maltose-1-phosphate maltosyltransferase 2 [Caloramator mitchellensis]